MKRYLYFAFVLAVFFFSCKSQTDVNENSYQEENLSVKETYYGIAKVSALDVSDSTVILEPQVEKVISYWEENIKIEALSSEEQVQAFKINSFTFGGRITVPDFIVNIKKNEGKYSLDAKTNKLVAKPIFLSAEDSSNGEADEI
ncbi:MAG: hypothetical protein K5829_09160, partial [Treponema sp.]|nr:hypothetical protein [Treponema sp.]